FAARFDLFHELHSLAVVLPARTTPERLAASRVRRSDSCQDGQRSCSAAVLSVAPFAGDQVSHFQESAGVAEPCFPVLVRTLLRACTSGRHYLVPSRAGISAPSTTIASERS